jgi:GNAT superfamily N-acetyltransferase
VWVVLCFYVAEQFHGKGLMKALLQEAVGYALGHGAQAVEGYPFEREYADDGAGGTIEAFRDAGFEEVRRIGEHQAVMRIYTEPH